MAIVNTGPVYGTTASSLQHTTWGFTGTPAGGWRAWSNPGNAVTTDSSFATVQQSSSVVSAPNIPVTEALVVSGFGLSLPANAAIVGIEVIVRGQTSINATSNPFTTQAEVVLLTDKTRIGMDSSGSIPISIGDSGTMYAVPLSTSLASGTTSSYTTGADDPDNVYGQFKQLVGSTSLTSSAAQRWAPADLNSSNFAVALTFTALPANALISIDSVALRVYYAPASTGRVYPGLVSQPTPQLYNTTTSPTNGELFWSSPNNALSTNGTEANVSQFSSAPFPITAPLTFSGFGLNIPNSATISGIRVFIVGRIGSSSDQSTSNATLLLDKNVIGENSAGTALTGNATLNINGLTTTSALLKIGGATNVWGQVKPFTNGGAGGSLLLGTARAWAPADLNSSNFAVVFNPGVLPSLNKQFVDSVSIEVFYDTSDPTQKTFSTSISQVSSAQVLIRRLRNTNTLITEASTAQGVFKRARLVATNVNEFINIGPQLSKNSAIQSATNNPTTSSGTGWTGVTNIYAQDSAVATITPATSGTAPLVAQGFNFSIPVGSTINGIEFDVYEYQSGGTSGTIDVQANAVKSNGTASASSQTITSVDTTTSYKTYGGTSTLWGETWAPADINSGNFGVQLLPVAVAGVGGGSTTSGYTNPSASVSSGAANNWSGAGNVYALDGSNASMNWSNINAVPATNNAYLNVSGFGFSLPSNATVVAVEVSISRMYTGQSTSGRPIFDTVQLMKASTRTGTAKSNTTPWPTSAFAYDTFGNTTTDLWGATLAYSDVNNSGFGVSIRPVGNIGNEDGFPEIDHVRMRVSYTTPSSPDRVLNVDHVRAIVNYTPPDASTKGFSATVSESAGTTLGTFTRSRSLVTPVAQTSSFNAAVLRAQSIAAAINEQYALTALLSRPISFALDPITLSEDSITSLQVLRAPVTLTSDPATVAQGTGTAWANITNVYAQDGAVATITPATSGNAALTITNFNFNLVAGVNILGIEFDAYAYQSGGTIGSINLNTQALKAGGATGSQTITGIDTTPSYKAFGSNSSLWGTTWTGADINNANFGVVLSPTGVGVGSGPTTSSYTFPTTGASETGTNAMNWSFPARAGAEDGSTTAVNYGSGGPSSPASANPYLNVTGFGFSLPSNATVLGVEVSIKRDYFNQSTGVTFSTDTVQLIKAGARAGTKKSSNTVWPSTLTYETFGDTTSDLWGTTLTYADVNASNFGVSIRAVGSNTNGDGITEIDAVRIRISYSTLQNPDRILNVDHVKAVVTYTPIDLKSMGPVLIAQSESSSTSIIRAIAASTSIPQFILSSGTLSRNRGVQASVVEATSISSALNRVKQAAVAIAELSGCNSALARLRSTSVNTISETTAHTFGALRRVRNTQLALAESAGMLTSMIRQRTISPGVHELEAVNLVINRQQKLAAHLAQLETTTQSLSRKRDIQATYSEVISVTAVYAKVKFMIMAIAETAAMSPGNMIRGRGMPILINEIETAVAEFTRIRTTHVSIIENSAVAASLNRFREQLVSIFEQEGTSTIALARIKGLIANITEHQDYVVAVSIILGADIPEVLGVQISWYETELLADGKTINYKLMTDTWQIRRTSDTVTIDIPVAPQQIINLD